MQRDLISSSFPITEILVYLSTCWFTAESIVERRRYGRVGKVACSLLKQHDVAFVAVDSEASGVARDRRDGHGVFYGDAAERGFLEACGLMEATGAIITIHAQDAIDAVPETIEASLQLSEATLVGKGVATGKVPTSIHEKRDEFRHELQKAAHKAGRPDWSSHSPSGSANNWPSGGSGDDTRFVCS